MNVKNVAYIFGVATQRAYVMDFKTASAVLEEVKARQSESLTAVHLMWLRYRQVLELSGSEPVRTIKETINQTALEIGWTEKEPIEEWLKKKQGELHHLKSLLEQEK